MSLTKPPIKMIDPGKTTGDLASTGNGIEVQQDPKSAIQGQGYFDESTGTLHLSLPNIGNIEIPGFMTRSSVGQGKQGRPGSEGRSGVDGILGSDGEKGATGCDGPEGKEGREGKRGLRGQKGEPGAEGQRGEKGDAGDDGVMAVFIQSDDPGPVGAGALWIKP